MRKFIFHWLDGKSEEGTGEGVADAFRNLGYGEGAIRALDYYDEFSLNDIVIKCKTCGHNFGISATNVEWYTASGLKIPTHCPACIKKRKDAMQRTAAMQKKGEKDG